MDLSIGKIGNIHNSKKLSFKGVKGKFNEENKPVFTFTPPPYDKNKEKASLELVPLYYNSKKNEFEQPSSKRVFEIDFDADKSLDLYQDDLSYEQNGKTYKYKGFAYRYKMTSIENPKEVRYITDSFEKIKTYDNDAEFSIIKTNGNYKIDPKKGAMRHSFLDSDAILINGRLDLTDKHKPRNHFNKMGGSTKGLIELLKSGELDPYRYILSTPDIGNDPTSSHGYWPNNLYQTKDMQAFKDLNYELFTRGKGYVADGAFTSQSLQSPLFQHVLKWGKQSPYYNMFKLDGAPSINLGVLPDDIIENKGDDIASKHIGVRIVNNPNDKNNYDETKPILLQFYDDRLSSEEQRNDSTKLIESYDTQPKDIFAITHNNDSVYPFYFELDPNENKDKIDLFKDKNALLLDEIDEMVGEKNFLKFKNFNIVSRNNASNAVFWDGNRDIVKLNLSNPKTRVDGEISNESIKGMKDARNYLFGVARFYTEGIQSDLLKRTAGLDRMTRKEIAEANGADDYQKTLKNIDNASYPILERNKAISEYISDFPLQSLETSPELSAVFAEPDFNKELLQKKIVNEGTGQEETIENALNRYVDFTINRFVEWNCPKEDEKAQYKTYITKIYANEIIRHILGSSLIYSLDSSSNIKTVDDNGEIDVNKLKNVTLNLLAPDAKTPQEERSEVIDKIAEYVQEVDLGPILNKMANESEYTTLDDFKESETLMLQSNAGLNWRFDAAKDIGDLDSVREHSANFKDIWDGENGVVDFWRNFIKEVRDYNPSSYIIAEITDMWSFYNSDDEKVKYAFDKNKINPDDKEKDFLYELNATTNSNYGQYFNKLSCFIGTNPEKGYDDDNNPIKRAGNLGMLKDAINKFVSNSQPQNAILTHEFFDNHDKPRLMHCLPLNMQLYLCGTDNPSDTLDNYIENLPDNQREDFMKKTQALTGRNDFTNINPMALSVGFTMNDEIDKSNYSEEEKNALKGALRELVNGQKTQNSAYNYKRAKSFGTKPYEFTIREMFERAGLTDNLDDKVKDFHSSMLKPSMEYMERLWQVMNGIVGIPTLFNGTEFAQSGYETLNKNVYVDNRNQILHELKNDPRYKGMFDKMYATSDLYKQPQMSAMRDGFPMVCKITDSNGEIMPEFDFTGINEGAINWFVTQINKAGGYEEAMKKLGENYKKDDIAKKLDINNDNDNHKNFIEYADSGKLKEYCEYKNNPNLNDQKILPIFKYDDKGSKVLSLITNNGVPNNEYAYKSDASDNMESIAVDSVDLLAEDNSSVLPEGTTLKKKVYEDGEYKTEKDDKGNDVIYKIKNGKLTRKDGKKIELEDTVVNFFVDSIINPCYSPYNKIN